MSTHVINSPVTESVDVGTVTAVAADLADALHRAGLSVPVVVPETPIPTERLPGPRVVLLAEWTQATAAELSRAAWRGPDPQLPVRLDGGLVLIGPVLRAGATACLTCAEQERLRVLGHRVPSRSPQLRLGGVLPPPVRDTVAGVLADLLTDPDRYDGVVVAVRTDQVTVSTHRLRPRRGGCLVCAPLPLDVPAAARVDIAPTPTSDPYSLRGPNPLTTRERLREALFDWRHGPVGHVRRTERFPLPLVTAELIGDRRIRESGYGRALTYPEAERVALFEAVERYTGASPHRVRTAIEASFEELGPERAVDPVTLGLHAPEYDHHPASMVVPYSPSVRTQWVYAWSLRDERARAVPAHVAYWDLPAGQGGPRFLYESSNGCGLGNSLVEAILYGLFEVVERDAFLMAWYAQTPLRRISLADQDPLVPHLADRLEEIDYELMFFDATNDLGVPVALSLALYRGQNPHAPQAFFAAGAHPAPRSAVRGAAVEVAINVLSMPEYAHHEQGHLDRERLLPMLERPELVHTLKDHVALNTLPEVRDRYAFLFAGDPEPVHWRQLWPDRPQPVHDLDHALRELVAHFAGLGLDVLAVDQTDPIIRDQVGLHATKVIVPGTLPMTFGHVHHRTRGLPRLLTVPYQLGRVPAPLRYEDLPIDPHPFP